MENPFRAGNPARTTWFPLFLLHQGKGRLKKMSDKAEEIPSKPVDKALALEDEIDDVSWQAHPLSRPIPKTRPVIPTQGPAAAAATAAAPKPTSPAAAKKASSGRSSHAGCPRSDASPPRTARCRSKIKGQDR